jgi:feruloyl esterase
MKVPLSLAAGAAISLICCGASPAVAKHKGVACADLKAALDIRDTTITLAETLPAGANPSPVGTLPVAICRVVGVTAPAVTFEVWMPTEGWNGKFQMVGNGGTAGVISYAAMRTALTRGYATASTDTGHVSSGSFDSTWALGRPDLVADFGHRGTHVTTVNGKLITREFYGERPRYSYFVGCSKGGQQGLMEAQRYPEDFDGIIAGDPANNWTRFYAGAHLWYSIATLKDPESYIPASKTAILGNAVTAACDAIDGIADGILDDPRKCNFDPAVLTCQPGQDPATCYTPKQVKAIKDIWNGVRTPSGELVHQPLVPGGEAGSGGWAAWTTGSAPFTGLHWLAADGFFRYMVFNNPSYDPMTFNFASDLKFALRKVGPVLDAVDPDLRELQRRRAKLIVYHGWSDPDISPLNSIDYFESVVSFMSRGHGHHTVAWERGRDDHADGREERGRDDHTDGRGERGHGDRADARERTNSFFRLFMVPGMQHCSGGPGPNTFDMLTALENWVEKGKAPTSVIASSISGGQVVRSRPLCVYPRVAVYTGSGSSDDAANFKCRLPHEERGPANEIAQLVQ